MHAAFFKLSGITDYCCLTVFAPDNLSFKVTISSNALAWIDYQFQLIIFEIEHTFVSNAEHKFLVMYLSIESLL